MKSTLYTVDYWVPFPRSKYGGLCVVIANDDEECFNLLKIEDEYNLHGDDYDTELRLAIKHAYRFELAHSQESRVVVAHTT
jgi:hypothetical protein